jgi:hypothetical protein
MKKDKDIVKKFNFSKEELNMLQDLEIGITASRAQLDGMQVYKNGALSVAYKRLGIDDEAKKGYTKSIRYNLHTNEIVYTESPINEDMVAGGKN